MGVKINFNCSFDNFIFEKGTNNIIGVNTSKGIIPCDNIFVCAGVYSPYIVNKLGINLPIITFSFNPFKWSVLASIAASVKTLVVS